MPQFLAGVYVASQVGVDRGNMIVEEVEQAEAVCGAWYKARNIEEIRRVFGEDAAKYLSHPRRVSFIVHDKRNGKRVQFATIGDSTKAIGMDGTPTTRPAWDLHWLTKVKEPDKVEGLKFKVACNWEHEAKRRTAFSAETQSKWFHPEFANKVVTASHESYSGVSLWVRGPGGHLACIPRAYLKKILTAPEKAVKVQSDYERVRKDIRKWAEENFANVTKVTVSDKKESDMDKIGFANGEIKIKEKPKTEWGAMVKDTFAKKYATKEAPTMDAKVRLLESRIRELEAERDSDFIDEDPDNDLDHSMVLDLPPEIAEWAKAAGVGLEDMLPLAEKICSLQSEQNREVCREQEQSVRSEYTNRNAALQAKYDAEARQTISEFRHSTIQTLIQWGSGGATISYLAYNIVQLFV